jgi:glycosyltransferase involved in cell wall biosynthesis
MESSTNIRVLHSTSLDTRSFEGRNIKGSRYVVDAVNKLKSEQLPVELIRVERITANLMRYVQAQADVVVDQLIYGTFGSTSLECLALGKPVICFIRPSWREFLESRFPEWKDCPIISATPETVYLELKALVVDSNYRAEIAAQSRRFASEFLDVRKNVIEFEDVLLSLR